MPARRITVISLSLAILLVGTGGRPAQAPSARGSDPDAARESTPALSTIEGTVRVMVGQEAAPPMLSPYARRRYRPPTPTAPNPGSPTNVVVYVLLAGGTAATAPAPAEAAIEQRNRAILPHVTAIQRGARVRFPNRDDVFHNLFSLSDTHPFNLGRYAPGESRSESFPRAGIVRMFCDIHSEMGGTILVLDTWLFARPDADGSYRIADVPAGRHRVVAWHDTGVADTTMVDVGASGVARVDFELND